MSSSSSSSSSTKFPDATALDDESPDVKEFWSFLTSRWTEATDTFGKESLADSPLSPETKKRWNEYFMKLVSLKLMFRVHNLKSSIPKRFIIAVVPPPTKLPPGTVYLPQAPPDHPWHDVTSDKGVTQLRKDFILKNILPQNGKSISRSDFVIKLKEHKFSDFLVTEMHNSLVKQLIKHRKIVQSEDKEHLSIASKLLSTAKPNDDDDDDDDDDDGKEEVEQDDDNNNDGASPATTATATQKTESNSSDVNVVWDKLCKYLDRNGESKPVIQKDVKSGKDDIVPELKKMLPSDFSVGRLTTALRTLIAYKHKMVAIGCLNKPVSTEQRFARVSDPPANLPPGQFVVSFCIPESHPYFKLARKRTDVIDDSVLKSFTSQKKNVLVANFQQVAYRVREKSRAPELSESEIRNSLGRLLRLKQLVVFQNEKNEQLFTLPSKGATAIQLPPVVKESGKRRERETEEKGGNGNGKSVSVGSEPTPVISSSSSSTSPMNSTTLLYLQELKTLPDGLEKESLKVLMSQTKGWTDLAAQEILLNELAFQHRLIRFEQISPNSPLVRVALNHHQLQQVQQSSQQMSMMMMMQSQQQPSQSSMIAPQLPPPQQQQHDYHYEQQLQDNSQFFDELVPKQAPAVVQSPPPPVKKLVSVFTDGRSPLSLPPPMLVRSGVPQIRSKPELLVKAPPPGLVGSQ